MYSRGEASPSREPRSTDPEHLDLAFCLRVAVNLANTIGHLHQRGIIHKDIKPANVLVKPATGQCWLMGFGIASRLPRERQSPGPPEFIAGTLAYMAPEQTGRMNRSIDSRSDLYALGVSLYEMLTGSLPFTASDPMEWVHCHIARQPVAPAERLKDFPRAVSAIIMKLLAKTAEDRYQTAAGLESDLRRCLAEWEAERRIDDSRLASRTRQTGFGFPRNSTGESARSRLCSPPSTALSRAAHRSWCLSPDIRASANPPSSTSCTRCWFRRKVFLHLANSIIQARHPLFDARPGFPDPRPAPSGEERGRPGDLARALLEALGPNGRLMIDLVPELKLIIGTSRRFLSSLPKTREGVSNWFPAVHPRVRAAGTSAGALPRRLAMA